MVLGISVDSPYANKEFADKIGVKFQLLSDFTRKVSKEYGILDDDRQFARRTTFVVDKEGKIQHIEAGRGAIDPTGAIQMCSMLKKKASE